MQINQMRKYKNGNIQKYFELNSNLLKHKPKKENNSKIKSPIQTSCAELVPCKNSLSKPFFKLINSKPNNSLKKSSFSQSKSKQPMIKGKRNNSLRTNSTNKKKEIKSNSISKLRPFTRVDYKSNLTEIETSNSKISADTQATSKRNINTSLINPHLIFHSNQLTLIDGQTEDPSSLFKLKLDKRKINLKFTKNIFINLNSKKTKAKSLRDDAFNYQKKVADNYNSLITEISAFSSKSNSPQKIKKETPENKRIETEDIENTSFTYSDDGTATRRRMMKGKIKEINKEVFKKETHNEIGKYKFNKKIKSRVKKEDEEEFFSFCHTLEDKLFGNK
ncbi:MAG: hypothetical protein MJ252_23765 [archaeon]|nr:hypothetical protein [archaeon]